MLGRCRKRPPIEWASRDETCAALPAKMLAFTIDHAYLSRACAGAPRREEPMVAKPLSSSALSVTALLKFRALSSGVIGFNFLRHHLSSGRMDITTFPRSYMGMTVWTLYPALALSDDFFVLVQVARFKSHVQVLAELHPGEDGHGRSYQKLIIKSSS